MTTIETITEEQIRSLYMESVAADESEMARTCARALEPSEDARVIWAEGPEEDHDTGVLRTVKTRIDGGWDTEIGWDSGVSTTQWYEIVPTEAAHACVEAIREAELA